jgi:mannose-1-phosphate guanylyltransferase
MTSAMVLSAGFGTRLRPLTDELAKPLMPVGDRPMLAHVVETLARGGVRHVVINTHHRAADFSRRIEELGASIRVVHESEILGTAGGVAHASAELGASDVVVWNGDILAPDLDVGALVDRRAATGSDTLWVVEPRAPGEGTVGLDAKGNVVRLRGERFGPEAFGGDFLGIQAMSAAFRAGLPEKGCLVADVALPLLRRGGSIGSFAFEGSWDDVGTPETLLRANLRWLERHGLASHRAPDALVEEGVRLERSIVGASAVVRGAGLLRECMVFPGAELGAPASRTIAGRAAMVRLPDPAAPTG